MKSILFALLLIPSFANANESEIFGTWLRQDNVAIVKIYQCGANICAKNLWIGKSKDNEKVGDVLIMNLGAPKNQQFKGTAFDPQRNLTFHITVNYDEDALVTKGCVFGGLVCKARHWKRQLS